VRVSLLPLLFCAACAHSPASHPVEPAATSPSQALALRAQRRPERFKMVHQVVARYAGGTYAMTGYMLGRKDGAFRVSAFAEVGPALFDVAKEDGAFQAQVHFAPLADKLDAVHIARAIDRIFGAECASGGERRENRFAFTCPIAGDDEADRLQMDIDVETLALVRKVFFLGGTEQVSVSYGPPKQYGEEWLPTRVHLQDVHGYSLDVAVSSYEPGFAFDDALLRLK
jgi:hypothetical protein